ncbi:MAG: hypothetical protein JW849_06990 [Phycisphaerae bacterium]|nr:hypothetical protein [Phycisphaerae bacterium]
MNSQHEAMWINLAVALFVAMLSAGCNTRPDMPKTKWYGKPVRTLTVDAGDAEEARSAVAVETARKRYYHDLMLLSEYYETTGNVTKGRWAQKELNNLSEAQDFTFVGIDPPPDPQGALPADAKERMLLENVTNAREDYLDALDDLATFYEKKNDDFKARMIQTALARFFAEETYLFLHRVEVPPETLEPCKIIPRANEMYDRALALYEKGARSLPVDFPSLRQALGTFLRLVRRYPQSTRIASAAYHIGKIYGDFFHEPYLAVQWYVRAWTWDPYLPFPARYEAAVLCQEKLGEKAKALELFRESLAREAPYEANCKDARERIGKLSEEMEYTPPLPVPKAENIPPKPLPRRPTGVVTPGK